MSCCSWCGSTTPSWADRSRTSVIFGITSLILAAIYTLQLLAYHAWTDLTVVWTSIAAAFVFIRLRGVGPELMWWTSVKGMFQPNDALLDESLHLPRIEHRALPGGRTSQGKFVVPILVHPAP